MGRFLIYIYIGVGALLTACATPPETPIGLEQAIDKNIAISVPMRVTEKGLIVLEGVKVDGRALDFILDTGATQSAIFEMSLKRLDLKLTSYSETMVHGMMQSKQHRVVNLPKLEIGPIQFLEKPMVVLDDRDLSAGSSDKYDGLIGMDIMSNYQLYIAPNSGELRFIPNNAQVFAPHNWEQVSLIKNPFIENNRDLHFIELRLHGRKTPAMIDTGSEFSAMNWKAARFVEAKGIRKKLRQTWELQGAVGTFEPAAKVTMELIRSGQKFWDNKDFVIIDFKSLDILGVVDQPFVVIGMNLFREETIFIDFEQNLLAIKPNNRSPQPRDRGAKVIIP